MFFSHSLMREEGRPLVPSSGTLVCLWWFWLLEYVESNAVVLPQMGHECPLCFYLVLLEHCVLKCYLLESTCSCPSDSPSWGSLQIIPSQVSDIQIKELPDNCRPQPQVPQAVYIFPRKALDIAELRQTSLLCPLLISSSAVFQNELNVCCSTPLAWGALLYSSGNWNTPHLPSYDILDDREDKFFFLPDPVGDQLMHWSLGTFIRLTFILLNPLLMICMWNV